MKRTPLRRRAPLRAKTQLQRGKPLQRTASMAASERQRAAVAGRSPSPAAPTSGSTRRPDPRSLGGCGDPPCVVPLCRRCHRAYDRVSSTCCRTWNRRGGRSLRTRSGTSG